MNINFEEKKQVLKSLTWDKDFSHISSLNMFILYWYFTLKPHDQINTTQFTLVINLLSNAYAHRIINKINPAFLQSGILHIWFYLILLLIFFLFFYILCISGKHDLVLAR